MSELRELSSFERGFYEAGGEEVSCYSGIEIVTDGGSLDGNYSDGSREYFGGSANLWEETYADYHSVGPAALLFTPGINSLIHFLSQDSSRIYLPWRLGEKVSYLQ